MSSLTFTKIIAVGANNFGRPNTDPPTVVDVDNITLYAFTLNTDKMTYSFPVPPDYNSGALHFSVVWTNDGNVDDNDKFAKWRLDYQTAAEGDVVNGSHANSPKSAEDEYDSDTGYIEHHTSWMTIASSDFAGEECIFIKISAVTPTGAALTCDPHLIGICIRYQAKVNR